ncbi:DUF1971 domain-containing protein [Enterobacteriaceae bacterium H20N1]|uniref:DUF1971 domain-containing protein n=1 Tax=Dryocola boscaweniae TaxID=2925397 RepID=A0A9X2WB21_9ENTR|nr:DUF1971 domain-containing protein [Dryocola boscaweniae]MCT4702644.1 DUF1971 domain-containing protein [Dryocola boscaweniae]MCT4719812.1 DUF1971 domain-containing protein [Dryocola boscaweniae]
MAHRIPADYKHTRSTPFWNKDSVPKALLTHHNTKKDVYGRLSVMAGAVKYIGFKSENDTAPEIELIIEEGHFGVSPPQYWHRIELLTEDTYFNIDFFAAPDAQLEGKGFGQVVSTSKE